MCDSIRLLSFLVLSSTAFSQAVVHPPYYPVAGGFTGLSDLDGDNRRDIAVMLDDGMELFRSADLASLLSLPKPVGASDEYGIGVDNVGDLDGDGFDEFTVSDWAYPSTPSGMGGAVFVYSSATGALLRTHLGTNSLGDFGVRAGSAGDADLDGASEVFVVTSDTTTSPQSCRIDVFSGASGAVLHAVTGLLGFDGERSRVGRAGDVDGDGREDLFISLPHAPNPGLPTGRLVVLAGANGAVILDRSASSSPDIGSYVAPLGDINGDGFDDLLVTEPGEGAGSGGAAYIVSGATALDIVTISAPANSGRFGAQGVSLGDLDGDAVGDFYLTYRLPGDTDFRLRTLSGRTGQTLTPDEIASPLMKETFNVAGQVVNLGDVNFDGREDLLCGGGWSGSNFFHMVLMGADAPSRFCAQPTSQCQPVTFIEGSQSLSIGPNLTFISYRIPKDANGLLIWSTRATSLPMLGGELCIARGAGSERVPLLVPDFVYPGECSDFYTVARSSSQLTSIGVMAGSTIYAQSIFRTPTNVNQPVVLSWAAMADILP